MARRYALYWRPAPGPLAGFGADWLGWDPARGATVPANGLAGLAPGTQERVTATPRKYGLHATLKPPFRLAERCDLEGLQAACQRLADQVAPVTLDGLAVAQMGRFLALRPVGETRALDALARMLVEVLDPFRAPLTEAELAKRRKARLTPAEDALLLRWGYPFVMEAFRFHVTLTGPLDEAERAVITPALERALAPLLPRPFVIDAFTLLEERNGFFHDLHRYTLAGDSAASAAATVASSWPSFET